MSPSLHSETGWELKGATAALRSHCWRAGWPPTLVRVLILNQLTAHSLQSAVGLQRGRICKTHPAFIVVLHILLKTHVWAVLALMCVYDIYDI